MQNRDKQGGQPMVNRLSYFNRLTIQEFIELILSPPNQYDGLPNNILEKNLAKYAIGRIL